MTGDRFSLLIYERSELIYLATVTDSLYQNELSALAPILSPHKKIAEHTLGDRLIRKTGLIIIAVAIYG